MLAIGVVGCAGAHRTDREQNPSGDPIIGLLSKGIMQLDVNIETLSKRMADARQASAGTDPALRELQALDLSGWQLHQQQWILQRDHLVLARDTLQRASTSSGEKAQLMDQWRRHWRLYVTAVEELRQQRHTLESKHLEVEARLIERGLQ